MISNTGSEPTIKARFGGTASADYKLPETGLNVTLKDTDTVAITIPSSVEDYKAAFQSLVYSLPTDVKKSLY